MKRLLFSLAIVPLLVVPAIAAFGARWQEHSAPVAVGEPAPDFTLEDQNGNNVTLSAVRGKSPVVLAFYRGYW